MFLPCPHCGYLVALAPPTPATDAGNPVAAQRCPRCDGVLPLEDSGGLDGSTAVIADPVASPGEPTPITSTAEDLVAAAPLDNEAIAEPAAAAINSAAPGEKSTATIAKPTQAAKAAVSPPTRAPHGRRAPSFARAAAAGAGPGTRWRRYVAIAALLALLALQLLLAQRDELAADERWRPWVAGLCNALQCEIPPWREPRAFTMLNRSVQPSRTAAGVLLVEASFRNDARWPQPWPTLLLSLADVEGRPVGLRAFAPSEYREGAVNLDGQLAPGQSAAVRLQVREPASGVVAFTFEFL